MRVIAYETVNRKGRKYLVYAGSVEHKNAEMFGQHLEPLVFKIEVSENNGCIDTIIRHGLNQSGVQNG